MSNQIVITSGAKLRDLDDVIIGTDGILSSVAFNVANGVPRLDENGKILVSQLPNSVMEFKGVWNAATNSPTLVNGTGNAGDVWLCNVAGTVNFGAGPIVFAVGDYAVYTGTVWARSSGATGTVTSVGVSRDGNALAITGSPVTSAGVINLGFSGDNTQYINGSGNLTTFPSLTGYVPYTGATTNVNLGTHTLQADRIGIGTAPNATVTLDVHRAGTIVSRIENTNADQDTLFAYASNGDNVWFNGIDYDGGNYNFGFYYSPDGTNVYRKAYFNNAGSLTAYSFIKIGGTSSQFLKADGSVDSNTYALDADVVHLTGNETIGGTKTFSNATKNNGGILLQNGSSYSASGYMNLGGMTNGLRFTSGLGISNYFALPSATGYTYTFPSATGTIALTSDLTGGTVTSVAMTVPTGLSIAGSPITSSGTLAVTFAAGYSIPTNASQTTWDTAYTNRISSLTVTGSSGSSTLISNVLNIPTYTLSGLGGVPTSRTLTINGVGYDLSADRTWTITAGISSVSGTAPISVSTVSGAATVSISQATTSTNGYLSFTDWNTFNNKQASLTLGNITSADTNVMTISGGTGAIIGSGVSITLIYASATSAGIVSTGTQTFAGAKTFSSSITAGALSRIGDVYIGGKSGTYASYADGIFGDNLHLGATGASGVVYINSALSRNLIINPVGGNIGLGVTPSAWSVVTPVIQISSGGGFIGGQGSSNVIRVGINTYYSGSNWTYINADYASWFETGSGNFKWYNAPSGSIGGTFTPNQVMTLNSSGNLSIGNLNDTYKLDVTGQGRFTSTLTAPELKLTGDAAIQNITTGKYLALYGNTGGLYLGAYNAGNQNYLFISNTGAASFYGNVGIGSSLATLPTTLTVKGGSIGDGIGKASFLSGGDENTWTALRNEVIRIGRGDIPSAYYHSIWSATGGSTDETLHWLKFYISNAGGSAQTLALTLNGYGDAFIGRNVTATAFYESSDSRLKTLIQDNYQTKGIGEITPKLYTKNGKIELGYYAQDFIGVLDSAISKGSDEMLSLSYREVHTAKIYALEQRIKELEFKLN